MSGRPAPVVVGIDVAARQPTVAVAISGNYAYVADASGADASGGVQVVDVSSPEHPRIVHDIQMPGDPWSVAVSGTNAYVVDQAYIPTTGHAIALGHLTRDAKRVGVNIEMLNQGASEISIMFGVQEADRKKAVRALYHAFFAPAHGGEQTV